CRVSKRPVEILMADGSWHAPRWRSISCTRRGSSITAITRIGFRPTGQRAGPRDTGAELASGRRDGHAGPGGLSKQDNLRRGQVFRSTFPAGTAFPLERKEPEISLRLLR